MTMSTPAGNGDASEGIEVRARTVDEAVARGLVRLGGLSRSDVRIEVVNPGKGGLLGFGAEEAVVRLVPLAPGVPRSAPAPSDAGAARPAKTTPPAAPRPGRAEPKDRADAPAAGGRSDRPAAAPAAARPDRPEPIERPSPPPASPRAATPVREAASPASPEDAALARQVVGDLLRRLGYADVQLDVLGSLLPVPVEDEAALVVSVSGPGTERLLAQGGKALYALQFIARLMLNRETKAWTNLLVDVNGDRARRLKEIFHMAEQSAALVEREGRPVSLPPMSPYERRVVHLALKDKAMIATQSIGSGPNRKVTVRRKDQLLPEL